MKFTRTPPVAACASTPETSIAYSAVPVALGTAPPPHPPAMPELSATPLTIIRWSPVRPPLAASAATSATTAPPTSRPPKLWLTPAISTPNANGVRELGIADDDLLVDDHLARRRLDVDRRRLTADGDGFFESADPQLGVERGCGRAGELHAFAPHRPEAGEGERDGVLTGTQVDDLIPAIAIGDGGAGFLDEHRAGGFHRHAWHDCA